MLKRRHFRLPCVSSRHAAPIEVIVFDSDMGNSLAANLL